MFMMMARAASMRSTCMRLNVGAVLVHNNRPVSVGWNGAAAGQSHCAGNDCPGVVPGNCGTIHAEENAINNIPKVWNNKDYTFDIYCTDSPCLSCCEKIIEVGFIKRVFFERPYRDPRPLQRLWEKKIAVYEVTPAGYTIDYFSRQVIEAP